MGGIRDHYQVLGVTESASDEDLKKAYRKLALIWHPDKNPHREEEAKKEFQFIQAAYDVLSDPQERAWYDRHKDAILSGFERDYKDDSVDILPYFTSACYSGFDDSQESFYSIYRELFARIASEDLKFKDEDDETFEVPSFGFSDSSYDEVVGPFYAYWQSYCTSKPFTWLDKYDIREADNRRILRLMEKENKKVRDQAKKERNEEVRNLVAFMRKRDRRVHAQKKLLEEKAAENARRAEENRQKQLAERLVLLEETREARRMQMTEIESQLKEIEASVANEHGDSASDEEYVLENENELDSQTEEMSSIVSGEDMYCPACNKLFKTAKAFHNHENSKRHKENVKRLRLDLLEDEEAASDTEQNVRDDESEKAQKSPDPGLESDISLDEVKEQKKKSKKNKKKPKTFEFDQESDAEDTDKFIGVTNENGGFSEDDTGKKKKGKKAKAGRKKESEKKEKVKIAEAEPNNEKVDTQEKEEKSDEEKEEKHIEAKQKGKKVEKELSKEPKPLECVKCKNTYPSKNKLFEHLKTSGHATYVAKDIEASKSKRSKKDLRRNQDF